MEVCEKWFERSYTPEAKAWFIEKAGYEPTRNQAIAWLVMVDEAEECLQPGDDDSQAALWATGYEGYLIALEHDSVLAGQMHIINKG